MYRTGGFLTRVPLSLVEKHHVIAAYCQTLLTAKMWRCQGRDFLPTRRQFRHCKDQRAWRGILLPRIGARACWTSKVKGSRAMAPQDAGADGLRRCACGPSRTRTHSCQRRIDAHLFVSSSAKPDMLLEENCRCRRKCRVLR